MSSTEYQQLDSEPQLALIVAVAENGVIGQDNKMPWHLPKDLQYFKKTTLGKPVVMGRKTFESIGKPLPGRTNIVVTRQSDYDAEGISVISNIEDGVHLAKDIAREGHVDEVMIIGGAELYKQTLDKVHRVYLTEVHAKIDGDAFFPQLSDDWVCISREHHAPCDRNPYPYSFCVFEKRI